MVETNNGTIVSNLDLNKLEEKLDNALSNETSESLNEWLKEKRMSNNKQTAVDYLLSHIWTSDWVNYTRDEKLEVIEQAKEKYEHEMGLFADEYASYVLEQSKPGIKGAMVPMCAWTFFKNRRQ